MVSNMVDTSLRINLNVNPSHNIDETPQREFEGHIFNGSKPSAKKEPNHLIEELNRKDTENKKLTHMLSIVCENYNALQSHLMEVMQNKSGNEVFNSRKRNTEDGDADGTSPKRPKEIQTNISRRYVRTDPSDRSLIVKDGYQWRKYGQKVTRDNPSPRAYFKCSFAPSCPVKKKVQRSVEDPCVVVATYEGEHNHNQPSHNSIPLGPTITTAAAEVEPEIKEVQASRVEKVLVEEMASSLTRNPSFTAALATLISNKILDDYDLNERWP